MSGLLTSAAKAAVGAGLIINMFCGGGGTAEGIKNGMGRAPDVNIDHDGPAIAMHAVNHPESRHYREDVWGVNPKQAVGDDAVDMLWLSPDCRHFSKAKGAKPVSKQIRGLANVAVKWAHAVKIRQGIILENVEEFETWGPLIETARGMMPCPDRKGIYFDRWVAAIKPAGATSVQWRTLRACDYGAPTIRKRLFLIARFDGKAIVWPAPTHGHPDSAAVKSGKLKPFRTAAECIDWSIPVPSIFNRERGELKDATCRRIAAGLVRYVIQAQKPFIVPLTHQGSANRLVDIDNPMPTVTGAHRGELALVEPTLVKASDLDAAPFIVPITHTKAGGAGRAANEPLSTITTAKGGELAVVTPTLVKAAHLMTMRNAGKPYQGCDEPTHTVTAGGAHQFLVEASLQKMQRTDNGEAVAAFMAQHNGGFYKGDGRSVEEPVSTITQSGTHQQLVTANLVKLRGTGFRHGQPVDEPMHTLTAGGLHMGLVYAFLVKYYGNDKEGQPLTEPLHTITHQARFGLVTVTIAGEEYVITDIGMRMLTPRELARAQGFPDSYVLDPVCEYTTPSGMVKFGRLPKAQQIAKIGNSVCPAMAEVLTAANFGPDADSGKYQPIPPKRGEQFDLFREAA